MNGSRSYEPVDRLKSININPSRRSFYVYVKITGVERDKKYKYRVRVIDAKGELIYDSEKVFRVKSGTYMFTVEISPNIVTDAPGKWTFQGILNKKRLFVENGNVNFTANTIYSPGKGPGARIYDPTVRCEIPIEKMIRYSE